MCFLLDHVLCLVCELKTKLIRFVRSINQVAITCVELIRDTAATTANGVIVFVISLAILYNVVSPWTAPVLIVGAALVGQVIFVPSTVVF